jgi:hypothetical protein
VYPLVKELAPAGEILDPMSGYGSLLTYCSRAGIAAFCLEFCLPLHLWQVLINPRNSDVILAAVDELLSDKRRWPRVKSRAVASETWFPAESQRLLLRLFELSRATVGHLAPDDIDEVEIALAVLCPFAARLSCSVPGNIATHVKKGGICVYSGWHGDFEKYLRAIHYKISKGEADSHSFSHTLRFGDCRTEPFPKKRFHAMITSPPYPNARDLSITFMPEIEFLNWLASERCIELAPHEQHSIGSTYVHGRGYPAVEAPSARRFLSAITAYDKTKRAQYDNKVYYLPYFANYFADLEKAFDNIAVSLARPFTGYIIVVDNTARDQIVPVSSAVMEKWQSLGYSAEVINMEERFHIGTKNPRARGLKARHAKYLIKVHRK